MASEAQSESTRNAVNHWFQSTLASRLNDKASGAIVTVMQRLHQHDLAGMLIESGGWLQLSLPAIATEDQIVPLTRGRTHHRRAGDVLHPAREPLAVLEAQRAAMGSVAFEAQYQQDPLPAVGNLIKAEWLQTYATSFDPSSPGQIVQSWDTAVKDAAGNDYSVCVTAHVQRREVRVLNVFRRRLLFPELKRHAVRLAREHRVNVILVEDQASGSQLIQTLRSEQNPGMPLPVARRPEGDKVSRMLGASGQIEAGQLMLPVDAPWLAEFKTELLGFPNARHDDQADALSQLMNWVLRGAGDLQDCFGGTILFSGPGDYGDQFGIGSDLGFGLIGGGPL